MDGDRDNRQTAGAHAASPAAVWEAAPDAVIVMDADGVVQVWNPAAEAIFGYSAEQAIGAEMAELIVPGPLRPAHRNGLSRYLATGEAGILNQRLQLSAINRDGQEFAVELTVTALPAVATPVRGLSPRPARPPAIES